MGWPRFAAARPNAAHSALAALETAGIASGVITQNVDGLHQQAGSRAVIDLHGRLDGVRCLGCGARWTRGQFQLELEAANPGWQPVAADAGPDGDMQLADADYARFVVPDCRACGGIVRPAVVFFGESLAAGTADAARATTSAADRLLVVGSSLTVFSGYRLVRDAAAAGIPVAALCLGQGRADGLLHLRVAADCGTVLHEVATRLSLSIAPY